MTDRQRVRWEFDPDMGNFHLRQDDQYIGHFYIGHQASGIDVRELLTRIAPIAK